jgi:hypothetical protein
MTALEITIMLKNTRDERNPAILWINHERRSAAVHPGGGEACCIQVTYNDAKVASADPAFNIIDQTDGEIYAA